VRLDTTRRAAHAGTVGSVSERPLWRTVAVPSEHGGWTLTLEPVLLGLVVAPSVGGVALGMAAFFAFLVRTPLKLTAVDVRRERWLERSRLASRIATAELIGLAVLVGVAGWKSGWSWLVPAAIAAPLVTVQLWFDVRSRGRRLVPELCGAIGIAAAAASIVLAAGRGAALATGVWLVLAARSVGAIPYVRVQIARLRRGEAAPWWVDAVQLAAIGIGAIAVAVDDRMAAGLGALAAIAIVQALSVRRRPVAAKVLGLTQMAMGLTLVAATAIGVLL
jgi:hypothetical protein